MADLQTCLILSVEKELYIYFKEMNEVEHDDVEMVINLNENNHDDVLNAPKSQAEIENVILIINLQELHLYQK
jgi:hypothetical protein